MISLEIYEKDGAPKEKKKRGWLKRKLGIGKQNSINTNFEELKLDLRFDKVINFENHSNYMQFLNSNLLEVCKKSGKKLVQMYPRNCQNYLSSLKDNTEVYIYTPSFNTIMAMGGLDILWPLADVLFLFSNNKIDNIHKLILSCIRLFIESVNQYPEFKLHLSRNDYVDSKIEGYYRKYMKIEMKESDSSGFYRSIFVNEGFTPDYMFLQEFPIQLLIDILLSR